MTTPIAMLRMRRSDGARAAAAPSTASTREAHSARSGCTEMRLTIGSSSGAEPPLRTGSRLRGCCIQRGLWPSRSSQEGRIPTAVPRGVLQVAAMIIRANRPAAPLFPNTSCRAVVESRQGHGRMAPEWPAHNEPRGASRMPCPSHATTARGLQSTCISTLRGPRRRPFKGTAPHRPAWRASCAFPLGTNACCTRATTDAVCLARTL